MAEVGNAGQALLGLAARAVLAGVWLYAGLNKVTDLDGSIRAVKAYELLPSAAAELVGAALPLVELALAALLLLGLATRLAAATSALLLTGFVIGVAAAWARGLQIDCGCFGGGGELAADQATNYGTVLARDVLFLLAAAWLLWRPVTRWSVDAALARRTGQR
ncbi:DoxX family membrane protein [Natronosporangium hydrolyticum]|uniref:DoxX family membrane protein n=1 Tax=Natronosporangium hydrolyticum TaxID=2811111 RepID=A0A895YE11_9ACTN|nr:MauE/DoxX family redox-associated membrane protein [Natronosporangium hydrolyticum]QSB14402.1 DoxX family membrane protein [Natronosporangium hydrolyticum]